MKQLITNRFEDLKDSFQISKVSDMNRMLMASKPSFKIGKNLLKSAIAFNIVCTIAYEPKLGFVV